MSHWLFPRHCMTPLQEAPGEKTPIPAKIYALSWTWVSTSSFGQIQLYREINDAKTWFMLFRDAISPRCFFRCWNWLMILWIIERKVYIFILSGMRHWKRAQTERVMNSSPLWTDRDLWKRKLGRGSKNEIMTFKYAARYTYQNRSTSCQK